MNQEIAKKKKFIPKNFLIIGFILFGVVVGGVFLFSRSKAVPIPEDLASQICQKIKQEDVKYFCLAQVNNDEQFCNKLDKNAKNVCLAVLKNDGSYCQNVPKNNRLYCYQNLVSNTDRPDSCGKLESPEEVSSCYVHFVSANYFLSNLSVINQPMCEKVLHDQPEHDLCLAMTTQNAAVCERARTDCLAYINKDISLCAKSPSKIDEGECYHALAMLKNDSAICERIDNNEAQDDCYRDYSQLSADQTLCNKISNTNQKDQCLANIAINLAN